MIDLVFRMIDKCIELVRQREIVDRRLFEDFAEPAIADFQAVHENYLGTFLGYRRMILESESTLDGNHPILAQVQQDMLFSQQLRSKIQALEPLKDDSVLGPSIGRIIQYTRGTEESKHVLLQGQRLLNAPRSALSVGLLEIFDQDETTANKRRQATQLVDRIVEELQWLHGQVLSEFAKLKAELLDRRLTT